MLTIRRYRPAGRRVSRTERRRYHARHAKGFFFWPALSRACKISRSHSILRRRIEVNAKLILREPRRRRSRAASGFPDSREGKERRQPLPLIYL